MNLKQLFGRRYRVTLDESWGHETEEGKSKNEWRYHEIKGKYGVIYPYSYSQLTCIFNSMIVYGWFKDRGWRIIQDGESEKNVFIPFESIEEVLKAIKPRKRRQLTEEQKKRLTEQVKAYSFRSNTPKNSTK
jgi:hypothetical protein